MNTEKNSVVNHYSLSVFIRVHPWPILFLCACFLSLGGCSPEIEYRPPSQKAMPPGQDPPRIRDVIRMADPDADAFIAQDVLQGAGGSFRWTGQRPRFKVWLNEPGGREFLMRFALISGNFQETGPVTVSITVNGRLLAAPVFAAAREYEYRHPVAETWLAAPAPIVLGLDIAPVYVAKADGVKLGVYLECIGLPKAGAR